MTHNTTDDLMNIATAGDWDTPELTADEWAAQYGQTAAEWAAAQATYEAEEAARDARDRARQLAWEAEYPDYDPTDDEAI
jgi:hypothetical protein